MDRAALLHDAMRDAVMSQSQLARISGVRQPSISQFLSGRISMSDDQVNRLLNCLGLRLVVERRSEPIILTRSERRSWVLHRQLAAQLTASALPTWWSVMRSNLVRHQSSHRGEPHLTNLRRWADIVENHDLAGLRAALTGLDRQSIEMREVSPMSGLLDEADRRQTLELDR